MNKRVYTPEVLEAIRHVYQQHEADRTCDIINSRFGLSMTPNALRGAVWKYKLHKTNRRNKLPEIYTSSQVEFLRNTYARYDAKETCRMFVKKYGIKTNWTALRTWMNKHGIFSGDDGKFSPGNKSWNTGTKGLTGRNKTSYRPGQLPAKTRPVGFERYTADGYVEVKVSDAWDPVKKRFGTWKRKNRIVWERTHGPIPDGMVVTFRNGDKSDCRIENLVLISKSVLTALRHQDFWRQPEEIKPVLMTLTQLRMKVQEVTG